VRNPWAWALVVLFVLQLALVSSRHEPWFDEAQSWLLARDSPLWDLLTQRLRYEGSPGLWQLLLWLPAHLGAPYRTASVIGAVCATAGAALIALRAPFPLLIRAALLLTFVVGYQYAVIARSYTLFPLLLFGAAALHPARWQHPWRYVGVLIVLANVSVHGLLVAGGLLAVHGVELWRRRAEIPALRGHLAAMGLFAGMAALIAAQLRPPPDLVVGAATNVDPLAIATVAGRTLNNALTGHAVVSTLVVLASGWWFTRRGVLLLWAVPTALLLLLAGMKYSSYWHDGMVFLVWVFAFWVGEHQRTGHERWRPARAAGAAALLVALAVQVGWWVNSVRYDWSQTYSASGATAAHLRDNGLTDGTVVAAGFHSIAIAPYFHDNIFDNLSGGYRPTYYVWSSQPPLVEDEATLRAANPDVIVWGVKFPWQQQVPEFEGYERAAEFEGGLFWKTRVVEPDSYIVFERS
jgi:hypothetical protein